jgi:hypothetical protein
MAALFPKAQPETAKLIIALTHVFAWHCNVFRLYYHRIPAHARGGRLLLPPLLQRERAAAA